MTLMLWLDEMMMMVKTMMSPTLNSSQARYAGCTAAAHLHLARHCHTPDVLQDNFVGPSRSIAAAHSLPLNLVNMHAVLCIVLVESCYTSSAAAGNPGSAALPHQYSANHWQPPASSTGAAVLFIGV
jgi:hypothetical protein